MSKTWRRSDAMRNATVSRFENHQRTISARTVFLDTIVEAEPDLFFSSTLLRTPCYEELQRLAPHRNDSPHAPSTLKKLRAIVRTQHKQV
jgi:hypothetical protein